MDGGTSGIVFTLLPLVLLASREAQPLREGWHDNPPLSQSEQGMAQHRPPLQKHTLSKQNTSAPTRACLPAEGWLGFAGKIKRVCVLLQAGQFLWYYGAGKGEGVRTVDVRFIRQQGRGNEGVLRCQWVGRAGDCVEDGRVGIRRSGRWDHLGGGLG